MYYCWKRQVMVVCVQCPSIWMNHLNKTGNIILKQWSLSVKINVIQSYSWEGGWTALKQVMHLSTYYIFLQEYYFLLKGTHCLQGNYFEEVESLQKKNKKNERKAELLKGVLHLSTQSSFLARILLLIQGSILSSRQIVTCKQHWTILFQGMQHVSNAS